MGENEQGGMLRTVVVGGVVALIAAVITMGVVGLKNNMTKNTDRAVGAIAKENGQQVGGRNLLSNSRGKFQPNGISGSRIDNYIVYYNSTVYMTKGQQYTVHADASSGLVWSSTHNTSVESNNVVLWIVGGNVNTIVSDANTGTGTTFTWDYPSGTYYLRVNTYKSDNSGYVENVKVEKGNVATDWTPAPED